MNDRPDADYLEEWYDSYPRIEAEFQAALDESLNPRGAEALYDIVGGLELSPGSAVLDLGCGEGQHTIDLAGRFGFSVVGIDPVERHIALARQALGEATESKPELRELVGFGLGAAGAIPLPDAGLDFIWCREVLVHVEALDAAFAECRRVLRSGGWMLIHDTYPTERLGAEETRGWWGPHGTTPAGADPARVEAAFLGAGFAVEERIDFGSEWGERSQEASGAAGWRLLHAARLLRDPDRYVERFGRAAYDIMLGDCLWHVYRMIGKLSGRAYLLKRG